MLVQRLECGGVGEGYRAIERRRRGSALRAANGTTQTANRRIPWVVVVLELRAVLACQDDAQLAVN